MSTNESLKTIAARLYKENICVTPLDERSLETVSGYMNYYLSNNDLCRRLSDVELNYVQISSEAESASNSVAEDKESVVTMLRKLTDLWRSKGYFLEYFFSSSETDGNNLRQTYLSSLEFLRVRLNSLSRELLIISETAAQIRACSASFNEVYRESKLAVYAATLNRDVDSVLDSRATSLQAHASAKECERLSSKLLGNARACTRIINCINNMIIEANDALALETPGGNAKIYPAKVNNAICSAVTFLENIDIEKFN